MGQTGGQLGAPTAGNMARWFRPNVPMLGPEHDPERLVGLADISTKLARALKDGMVPIGLDCIKQNAQFVFHFYEATISITHLKKKL